MVTSESALAKHCQGIESAIASERQRLQSTKDQLKQYGLKSVFDREREEAKRRDAQIRWCRKQLTSLRIENDKLRKDLFEAGSRRIDERVVNHKKRLVNIAASEIDSCRSEIDKLDKALHIIREGNEIMAKDQEKKLRECHGSHGFIMKPRSSGCLQLGRLMMEQEDAKQALSLANDKKERLVYVIRELKKNLIMAERECCLREEQIRVKESKELERHVTLIEKAYKRQKEINDGMERGIEKARSELQFLESVKNSLRDTATDELQKLEEDKVRAESYRVNMAELNLIASTLCNEIFEITKRKTSHAENFMKMYEESMRQLNIEIFDVKSKNAELDGKIERIQKSHVWMMKNFEKKVEEREENREAVDDKRRLTLIREAEDEARHKLHSLKETSKKLKENIEHLLNNLLEAQLQCLTKERLLEDMSKGIADMMKANEMALEEKIQFTNNSSCDEIVAINSEQCNIVKQ